MVVDVELRASAHRHGIAEEDIRHAVANPVRIVDADDFTMIVGPDRTGRLIEVGVSETDYDLVIFHAMPARDRYLR